MRELALYHEVLRRRAALSAGRNPHNPSYWLLHQKFEAGDAEHAALPDDTENAYLPQTADGSFKFLLGWSEIGGPDVLG